MDRVIHGDCLEVLKQLGDSSVDSVVTDPPYGLSFMGASWDTFKGNRAYAEWVEQWAEECLRVLKPGGHFIAFSGTRTYHALAWGVEGAGFEIRDMLEFLYTSGMPKSMDVSKQFDKMTGREREATAHASELATEWSGWGTALKPAHEPMVLARKPLDTTICGTVEQYGTGAINIDSCRILYDGTEDPRTHGGSWKTDKMAKNVYEGGYIGTNQTVSSLGRFPANCVTEDDESWFSSFFNITPRELSKKPSKADKGEYNNHPTVKSIPLMAWLVKLVTRPGGLVLDPFAGSGTTLVAASQNGFSFVGIEREDEFVKLIHRRLKDQGSCFCHTPSLF